MISCGGFRSHRGQVGGCVASVECWYCAVNDVGVVGGVGEKWSLGFWIRCGRVGFVGSIRKGVEWWRWYRRRSRVSRRFSMVVVWGSMTKRSADRSAVRVGGGVGLGLRIVTVHWVSFPSWFVS